MANWLNDAQDGFSNLRRRVPSVSDLVNGARAGQFGGGNVSAGDVVQSAQPAPPQPAPVQPQQNPIMDQPPAAAADPRAAITRAQPNASFAQSSVQGIYKAVAPDGSVTFTDRPGGTFDANTAQPQQSGNTYDGAGRRIIGAQPGQLGVNRAAPGDFAAGDLTGHSGAKFLYRPQQGQDGADAGTASGATPGSSKWLDANNAPINPLSSPDAAASFASNKNAVSSLRRGDGQFNRTVYDPTNYRASNQPAGAGQFPGALNPLDLFNAQQRAGHLQNQDTLHQGEFAAAQNDKAQNVAKETVDRYMTDPRIQALPEGERRAHAAALALPDLHAQDPAYLNTREGLAGQEALAKHFQNLTNPGKLKNFFGDGPGPQQFNASDLADFQVAPDSSATGNARANVIGPGYVKGNDGNYQRVGPADTSPNSTHKYYSSQQNNVFGTNNFLTGGAKDSIFGEGNQGLLNYAPVLNHLRQLKYGKQQQK